MTEPDSPFKLTPQRIFLIVVVVVALGLAGMTIVSSLNVWRQNDAADAVAPASN